MRIDRMSAVDARASLLKIQMKPPSPSRDGGEGTGTGTGTGAGAGSEEDTDWMADAAYTGLWTYLMVFTDRIHNGEDVSIRSDKEVSMFFSDAADARACVTSFLKPMSEAVRRLWDANVRVGMPVVRHDVGYSFEKGVHGKGAGARERQAYLMAKDAHLVSEQRVRREALRLRREGDLDGLLSFFEDPRRVTFRDAADDDDDESVDGMPRKGRHTQVMACVHVGPCTRYYGTYGYIPVPAGETSSGCDDVAPKRMNINRTIMEHPLYVQETPSFV